MDLYLEKTGELLSHCIAIIALLLAILFPCFRAILRRIKDVDGPAFLAKNVFHDVAAGLLLPHFFGIILLPYYPGLLTKIERHAFAIVGIIGVVYLLRDLMRRE